MASYPDYSPTMGKLTPICGACCIMCSCNFTSPECVGFYVEDNCLCCYGQRMCCKMSSESFYTCIWCRSNCANGSCGQCVQSNCQFCCLDIRCALPTGPKNPLILNVLGVTVSLKCQSVCRCCANLQTLYGDIREELPARQSIELPTAPTGDSPARHRRLSKAERDERDNDIGRIIDKATHDESINNLGLVGRETSNGDDAFYRVETERDSAI